MVVQSAEQEGIKSKATDPWDVPWEITKQITDVVYKIQKHSWGKPKFVHHDRLKPYQESSGRQ